MESLNGKGGFWGFGDSRKSRGVVTGCFLAGLRGGGVKRGCLRGGDSHMKESAEEKDPCWGDGRGVAKLMFHPYRDEGAR